MNNAIICPVCKSNYDSPQEICKTCNFPFSGTEKEKSIFIGQQILKKGSIDDAKVSIKRARIILFLIGGFQILNGFIFYLQNPALEREVIFQLILGLIFIGFGIFVFQNPLVFVSISLGILVSIYLVSAIIDSTTLLKGISWKAVYLFGLIYSLVKILQADKIRKQNKHLNEQHYK